MVSSSQHIEVSEQFMMNQRLPPVKNNQGLTISGATTTTADLTTRGRSSPNNLDSHNNVQSSGARFSFSPMLPNSEHQNTQNPHPSTIIQEQVSDCESSFKNNVAKNSVEKEVLPGNSNDLAHQYFDFLNRENEKLQIDIGDMESQLESLDLQFLEEEAII